MASKITEKPISVENGNLVVRMPLGKGVPSSSGKSMVLASTGGFQTIEGTDGIKVNLTVIRKN